MANSDPLEIRLVDPDLLTTHGILPLMRADYYVQLNEPGSGNFEISTGSSLSSSVESDAFADVFYRGSSRGGFLVENISRAHTNSSEGGGRTVTASGRGSLALLEDAIVWDDGTGSTERTFNGTQAATLITLMEEAQNRGGLQNIIWDFSATDDTDSVAWTDDEDLVLTVGTSLLDVIRQISDTGIDFDISRSGNEFTLHAYKNGAGSNKSTTVYFRVGQNCEEVSSDEVGGDIRNVLKTKYEGGYTTVSNSASISARRRREGLLDARYAQTTTTARTFAAAHLDTKKDPKHQISIQVYDGVGPRVFVDYELGDTITLDIDGTETEYRIRGMHLHWDNSEYASVTLTMNDDVMENEIRLTREFNRLKTDFTSARDADLLDVSFWAAIGDPNISYGVYKLLIVGNTLYVANGYSLLSYDIDGGGWTRVVTAANIINSIAAIGSDLYLCGSNKIYKYSGGTLTTVGTAIYTPESSATAVLSMVAIGTDLFVGGIFDSIEGVSINGIAKYNGSWSDIGGTGYVGAINAMDTDGSNLFAGLSGYVKKWNGSSWTTLGSSFAPSAVLSVAVYQTELLAGTASNIYIWDGAAWSVLGGGVNGAVWAITTYLSDVYVGGAFTDRGNYIARFSGDEWIELEEGTNNLVKSLVMYNEDLYVAGTFTQAGDKSAQGIAAYFTNFSSFANYIEHAPGEFNLGEAIHNATAKTSLTGDDEIPLWDSISQALRKITWTNIIASIKTWADTIYVSLTGNQTIAGVKTFSSDPLIPDEAYDATAWNGSFEPPTKNAVRDKIESMGGGGTPGGSDTQVQYNNGGAFGGDSQFTWDDILKVLGVGNPSILPSISPDHTFWMTGDGISPSQFMIAYGSTYAPFSTFMKSDGSAASPTNVKNNQVIGRIRGRGYDGSGWTDTRLEIRFVADGDWASGDTPTRIELYTCPDGSGTLTLAMTIGSDGNVNIASGKEYRVNGVQHTHTEKEDTSNKATTMTGNTTSNIVFLTAKAIYDWAVGLFSQIGHTHTGLVTNGDSHDHNGGDGAQIAYSSLSGTPTIREVLTANRTYYVRTDGSDSNNGLANTAGGAFLTIQKAVDIVAGLDLSVYDVTIQVGNGTYTGAVTLKTLTGAGLVTIQGDDTTPANVIISVTSNNCFTADGIVGRWRISGVEMRTTTSGRALYAMGGTVTVTLGKNRYGTCAEDHIITQLGASVYLDQNYTISGGATRHWNCLAALIQAQTITVTLSGTPAFSVVFCLTDRVGYIRCNAVTFSGSATGTRYLASANSVIFTNGSGATFLPGNAAGSTATGGQYI